MSSRSNMNSRSNRIAQKTNKARRSKSSDLKNAIAKNHVNETTLSKSGLPFHFAGPKKEQL